jgi:hypothetical protein
MILKWYYWAVGDFTKIPYGTISGKHLEQYRNTKRS